MRIHVIARATLFSLITVATLHVSNLGAQSTAPSAAIRGTALATLDTWLITRFRSTQLLPDSGKPARTARATAAMARIESVSSGTRIDTVFAIQYGANMDIPSLPVGTMVRLASPTGALSMVNAEVLMRRPFRAPRHPSATAAGDFRYGWAYVALVRRRTAASAIPLHGWMMLQVPDSTRRR